MNGADAYFEDLLMRVIEGVATEDEFATFSGILRHDLQCRRRYAREMRLHVLLRCKGADASGCGRCGRAFSRATTAAGIPAEKSKSALPAPAPLSEGLRAPFQKHSAMPRNTQDVQARASWRKAAVAAAALLVGAGLWYGVPRPPSSVSRPPSPVTVVERKGVWGLELPQELPGRISLAKGLAKVRLPSGVELSLLGQLELEAEERGMEVRLVSGRLVAWVPARASGFTVRAPGLTAWDIRTVFSVAADADGSSLFVFKGSVQALDGEGNGVDLCEEGEGVWAMAGRMPFKVSAEGGTGERLFKAVRGHAAVAEPQKAFDAARRIGELWVAKYVPEEASRARETARQQAAMRNAPRKIPFTKTAWVRPSAPRQEEAGNMKKTNAASVLAAAAIAGGAGMSPAVSVPVAINTSPTRNARWSEVCTNEVPLAWEWKTNAANAQLKIAGMNGTFTADFPSAASNYLWQASASTVPSAEDVYDLTLTFYGGGGAVVGAMTSRLAVVTGAFGETAVVPAPVNVPWPKVKENAVIAYDAGWAEATAGAVTGQLVIAKAGGLTQTSALADASGYFGWKVKRSDWGYGTFNLALTFPGMESNAWDATLVRVPEGFMFSVR
ncbi:MAG: FecR family protein [Kiritimatiellae bacterium]|nr:FecR family protein [Kiritimatiellia bacterium]